MRYKMQARVDDIKARRGTQDSAQGFETFDLLKELDNNSDDLLELNGARDGELTTLEQMRKAIDDVQHWRKIKSQEYGIVPYHTLTPSLTLDQQMT